MCAQTLQVMQKRALEHPKITVLWDSVVEEAYGNERVGVRMWVDAWRDPKSLMHMFFSDSDNAADAITCL